MKQPTLFTQNQLDRIETAVDIHQNPGTIEKAVFQHSVLCQVFIPYQNPGDEVQAWTRKIGNAHLILQALEQTGEKDGESQCHGLPYGSNARLILTFANTQAVKLQDPTVPLGKNMSQFLDALKKKSKGKRTRESIEEQLRRLTGTLIHIGFRGENDTAKRVGGSNLLLIEDFDLWYPKDDSQDYLFPSFIKLGDKYFDNLMQHAVPLDERAVFALARDPMALDIYTWLAHRLHQVPRNKPVEIKWISIKEQFGQTIGRMDHFKEKFRDKLRKVLLQYPEARIEEETNKYFTLYNSPPPILKTMTQVPQNLPPKKDT